MQSRRPTRSQLVEEISRLKERIEELEKYAAMPPESETPPDICEARYRAIVEDQNELICRFLPGGILTFVNEAYCRYFGKAKHEFIGKSFMSLIPREDHDSVEKHFASINRENPVAVHEHRVLMPNGEVRWHQWSNRAIFDSKGSISEYQSVGRDITERKKMEEMLRESEIQYRTVLNTTIDGFWMSDTRGSFLDVNNAFCDIVGYSRDELLGMTVYDVDESRTFEEIFMHIQKAIDKGSDRFETNYRRKDGHIVSVEVSINYNYFYEVGGRFFSFVRDITERKQTEEILRESEEKLQIMSMSGKDAIVLMDNEGYISFINPAAEKILGYAKEEVVGKPVFVYLSPENYHQAQRLQIRMAEAMPHMRLAEDDGISATMEMTATRKDGKDVEIELSLLTEMVGGRWHLIGIFRDITERKKTADELRKSEEKYRRLFEESHDVVFITSPDGRLIDINRAGFELFGYRTKKEILNVRMEDLYANPEDRKRYKKEIEKKGYVNMYELVLKRKDGERIVASVTANAVRDVNGKVIFYQGIMRDLTDIKKLEQQLIEFHKLEVTGQLIGEIAHNFNNILNIILGNAQLTKMVGAKEGSISEYLSSIEDSVFRASEMVEQLLAFGRRQSLDVRIVDLNGIVMDFVDVIGKVIGEDIQIKTCITEKLPKVRLDITRMHQVLTNFVLNSRDAMSGKGILTIETGIEKVDESLSQRHMGMMPGQYVVLSIKDNGIGMDSETMRKIFQPFFTTKQEDKRKGLGLSVVYGIVKQHGGYIDVESEPDIGTTFKVFLPKATESLIPPKVSEEPVKEGNETILVAEDEPSLRQIASGILTILGYKVLLASDGEDALRVFRENSTEIDLILLDIVMPKLNGREAYREMQKINPRIPVIFITGYSLDGIQASFIAEEGFDAIQKPCTLNALGRKIREVLDRTAIKIKKGE